MSVTATISLPENYPPYQVALASVATLYAALFVMTSNHFVFKPKIESLFQHSSIHSPLLYQFLVDALSNLTHLTFILSSLLLFRDDNALSVMLYSDISWTGLLLGVVAFKAVAAPEEPHSKLLLVKSVVFLLLAYGAVAFHYVTKNYLVSIGLVLVLLYVLNLLANGYEDKFVGGMEYLFGYRPNEEPEEDYSHCSNLPSPEYLSRSFPLQRTEVPDHIRDNFSKLKNIRLTTKRTMVENLLKITLAVHLSRQKLENKAKRDIKHYYGAFNGTVAEKGMKVVLDKGNTQEEQGSQDDLVSHTREEDTHSHNSAIFYIFPVRMFEGSKALSVLFSISVNLGLGVLLSVVLRMAETLQHGQYFQLFFGLLLLPVLPAVSKQEFMNSMALSALWKYCLYGLFLSIVCLSSDALPYFSFAANKQLVFAPLVQMLGLSLSTYFAFQPSASPYNFCFVWLASVGACSLLIFKHC